MKLKYKIIPSKQKALIRQPCSAEVPSARDEGDVGGRGSQEKNGKIASGQKAGYSDLFFIYNA